MALDNTTLRKVQLKELEILLEVKRVCEKHDIRFQLYGGTLLGAIRHQGFIPWDDDIDIAMLREDYERFLQIAPEEISDKYYVESSHSNPDYVYSFCKVKANGTLYVEECTSHLDIHQGIWIDIFPLDYIPEIDYKVLDRRDQRLRRWQTAIDYNAGIVKLTKLPSILYFKLQGLLYRHRLMHKKEKIMQEADRRNRNYVVDYNSLCGYRKSVYSIESCTNLTTTEFEGHLLPVSQNYHSILSQVYGDYMTPPPVEKRVSEHGIIRCEV